MRAALHAWRHANPALQRLCSDIDAAFEAGDASFGARVRAALAQAIADPGLLDAQQRIGDARGYRRHLLAADPLDRYAIAALVWEPGQASPVHGHRTWCGYAVIDGTLAETLYRWDADTHCALETRRHPRAPGAVSFVDAGRGAIHRLGNPADAGTRAVSIHVYGVAGEHIATHVNDLLAA
ncbi:MULTISPECIES: cysteine dioxygenase family protein [unclassified Caballeronia]|uniref:cysteine dioxygenase family protein n=1 Tax=unclassified Caballeronia TaxID=2646786 RepID=UPI002856C9CD|nr:MULTISPECIES: cysteine dioxygenase family protein [unclassified Caballeronia]MDR5738782.1 cysteine dioxygenase family protein [Caballeronia sp. LZ016]MDR5811350.1 cysteine dioxygenase family protein [Caballeronia sp. LZ019]